jgi:hypothetical protein
VFHASEAFEVQHARVLPVGALFDAVQQCDCEAPKVAGLRSERQLSDVNGGGVLGVVLGVGSTECRQGKVVGNKVPRGLFKLCQWSVRTACNLSS